MRFTESTEQKRSARVCFQTSSNTTTVAVGQPARRRRRARASSLAHAYYGLKTCPNKSARLVSSLWVLCIFSVYSGTKAKLTPLQLTEVVPITQSGPRLMNILIADDELLYRELLAAIIDQWPEHQATVVDNGLDAWRLLDDPRRFFDVVFLDIKMPGLSGLEVLKKVRSNPLLVNTAIIIFTAYNDQVTIEKAIRLGAKHFILKPCTEATVADKLRSLGLVLTPSPEAMDAAEAKLFSPKPDVATAIVPQAGEEPSSESLRAPGNEGSPAAE